jgi:hypothetical protein
MVIHNSVVQAVLYGPSSINQSLPHSISTIGSRKDSVEVGCRIEARSELLDMGLVVSADRESDRLCLPLSQGD